MYMILWLLVQSMRCRSMVCELHSLRLGPPFFLSLSDVHVSRSFSGQLPGAWRTNGPPLASMQRPPSPRKAMGRFGARASAVTCRAAIRWLMDGESGRFGVFCSNSPLFWSFTPDCMCVHEFAQATQDTAASSRSVPLHRRLSSGHPC